MRKSAFPPLLAIVLLAGLCTRCAFPSDPPVKPVSPNPPSSVIDTAKTLLTLRHDFGWAYCAIPKFQQRQYGAIVAGEINIAGNELFKVVYAYYEPSPPRFTTVFPWLLKNVPEGLSFYQSYAPADTTSTSRPARLQFVLPYPAKVGTEWWPDSTRDPDRYHVRVVAKDTAVLDYGGVVRKVYRYDVIEKRGKLVFYVLPGMAFIRVEHQEVVFQTFAWTGM